MGKPAIRPAITVESASRRRFEVEGDCIEGSTSEPRRGVGRLSRGRGACGSCRCPKARHEPRGIVICGSGLGRDVHGEPLPRACGRPGPSDIEAAEMARRHNDANVLAPGRRTGIDLDEAPGPIVQTLARDRLRGRLVTSRRVEPRSMRHPESAAPVPPGEPRGGRPGSRRWCVARRKRQAPQPRADRLGELRLRRRARGDVGSVAHQQVRRGLPRSSATTVAATSSTRPRSWRASAPRRSSGPTTRTSSRTRAPRPTRPSTAPSSTWATPSWP